MWKNFVKDYFAFTHKERIGVIVIFSIIVFFIFLPFAFPLFSKQKNYNYKSFEKEIASLKINNDTFETKSYYKNFSDESFENNGLPSDGKYENIKAEVFYFDPNTASVADWKKLGLRDKTIQTIQKYLSKGGKFYEPADIGKIWGLSSSDAQRLIPYVRIKNSTKEYTSFEKKESPQTSSHYPPKTLQPIDVNLADTTELISLPGIGSKLSQRIISFRNKLGGFYSIDQVGETYLLPDSTFQKIKSRLVISNTDVKHININIASIDEMKVHPYFRYNLANAIYQYRHQHGNFNSIEEIKKIMVITDEVFDKISPYISIN